MSRPTVTLCMIVKDESHIIKECLKSMLPYIDRYDITDTGSTDGTPELIKEFMDEHESNKISSILEINLFWLSFQFRNVV